MPPKQMLTKEKIVQSALQIAQQDGLNAVTARRLGMELGCSSRPIFTVFSNMEEVHEETIKAAKNLYNQYVAEGLRQKISTKGVGLEYIKFAREQPKLFQMLFMKESKKLITFEEVMCEIDENSDLITQAFQKQNNLSKEDAMKMYRNLWIYTHGIATLLAMKVCSFKDDEVSDMLSE